MKHYSRIFIVAAGIFNAGWTVSYPAMAEEFDDEHRFTRNVTQGDRANLLTAVVGTTSHSGTTELTLGVEYERRLGKSFGVGILAEHAFGALDSSVYALPVGVSVGSSRLYIAPGIEDSDHGSEFLVRLGGKFSIKFGDWEVSPQMSIDFVSGRQALLLGIGIGREF